ncbi:MAG: quinolinate synthase NadA [Deltaproteobacteria bacterium]|nr:quinolinate synthase NadA [Deltaproteobacteria bacterium]
MFDGQVPRDYILPVNGGTDKLIEAEADRLLARLAKVGWSRGECEFYAPITLKIRELAKRKNAVILAHSYQTPDIQFGIADFRGDSLALSEQARDTDADVIVFCGVRFMAETAKTLSPGKTVLLPAPDAGCSLSESITGEQVREMRSRHPDAAFVCYVNTSAEVKAECDVVCTSANAMSIVEGVDEDEIVFLPDRFMAGNIARMTTKRIHHYDGRCIVHETFEKETALAWKDTYPDARMLVHTESRADVVELADLAGGTGDMIRYVRDSPPEQKRFMLVTECGLSDRLKVEFPDKEFIGTCSLCPHMKRVDLRKVLQVLEEPRPEQVIEVPEDVRVPALRSIERMFELTRKGADPLKPHSNLGESSERCE